MAITDIVARLERDALAEADGLLAAAEEYASEQRRVAEADAASQRERVLERARADAARDTATLLANTRLAARDAELKARGALAAEVLTTAQAALLALPDPAYAAAIARAALEAAAGGETVHIAAADDARLRGPLAKALADSSLSLSVSDDPADTPHGVVLSGDRTRVEVSPAAMIDSRREELIAIADGVLFPEKGSA